MKYVLTGGAGNISKPLAEKLLAAGHQVTVIGRDAAHLEPLVQQGAIAAAGSVDEPGFLIKTFAGADAVYTMVPPRYDLQSHWKEFIGQRGKNYAAAIRHCGVKYVVNLSSIGAHLPDGAGPVNGLYRVEQALNELTDAHILHLRPSYFYANFFGSMDMIRNMGIMGSNFGGDQFTMVMSHTGDIAEAAAAELLGLAFTGHQVRYLSSDERSTAEIAAILGEAIGKPGLPWIVFSDEQTLSGMMQAGLPEEIARNLTEMGSCLREGPFLDDYWKNRPATRGRTKLEDFAKIFAAVYQNQ